MTLSMRQCAGHSDFPAISQFLYSLYQPDNADGNWFQPVWEYAYTHPWFDEESIQRIGIWEDNGAIIGVVLYESRLGEAFFQIHPAYEHLKSTMLEYAEQQLAGVDQAGKRYLKAFVNDFDPVFEQEVISRGYVHQPEMDRPMTRFAIPEPFPPIHLPPGFRLKSLADDNDLLKVNRVLHRGFNHPGEPDDDIEARQKMQSGPHFRTDLTIVVEAPTGAFVAFSGLWFEPVNRFGYVEPVATDPDYRRMGLGRAAVMEGIRRCKELGAQVVYVGSTQPFYLSMGFELLFTSRCWMKIF